MFSFSTWLRGFAASGITAVGLLAPPLAFTQEPPAAIFGTPAPSPTKHVEAGAKAKEASAQPAVKAADATCGESAWISNPPYRTIPRPGNFYVPPTGCGYYSLLDWVRGDQREARSKDGSAYPAFAIMPFSFFDADFRYVDAPGYQPDFLDSLHRIHVGDNLLFATGGQAQWRHMHEFSSRLTGKTNDYDLLRARVFGDVWYKDTFRIYVESISAITVNQDLAPAKIDENRFDILNLFVDVKVGELNGHNAYVRLGRQEMLLGSQRLISPLDWANTRRTFQGGRAFYQGDKVDVDLFWVQPVIVDSSRPDFPDHKQNFMGAWVTYHGKPNQAIDSYYLYLDNHNKTTAMGITSAPTSVHTLGSRYHGNQEGFLWDFEGMAQFGQRGSETIRAGSATAGVGYNFKNLPMNPTVWAYYDWASGDHNPNKDDYNTFNQLFPFGHYYFGFLDLVGRENIRDWNFHRVSEPGEVDYPQRPVPLLQPGCREGCPV